MVKWAGWMLNVRAGDTDDGILKAEADGAGAIAVRATIQKQTGNKLAINRKLNDASRRLPSAATVAIGRTIVRAQLFGRTAGKLADSMYHSQSSQSTDESTGFGKTYGHGDDRADMSFDRLPRGPPVKIGGRVGGRGDERVSRAIDEKIGRRPNSNRATEGLLSYCK